MVEMRLRYLHLVYDLLGICSTVMEGVRARTPPDPERLKGTSRRGTITGAFFLVGTLATAFLAESMFGQTNTKEMIAIAAVLSWMGHRELNLTRNLRRWHCFLCGSAIALISLPVFANLSGPTPFIIISVLTVMCFTTGTSFSAAKRFSYLTSEEVEVIFRDTSGIFDKIRPELEGRTTLTPFDIDVIWLQSLLKREDIPDA